MRAETGPMEFDGDWRGIFIRGDNAGAFALQLRIFLADYSGTSPYLSSMKHLGELLASSDHHAPAEAQHMKPFEECVNSEFSP